MVPQLGVILLAVCGIPTIVESYYSQQDCDEVSVRDLKGSLASYGLKSLLYDEWPGCIKWTFHKPYGQVATLSFTYLNLPQYESTSACFDSYLMVESHDTDLVICGQSAKPVSSPSYETQFSVSYYTQNLTNQGFEISYFISPKVSESCEGDEFHCDDGRCIRQLWRCNGQQECSDGSDEKDCRDNHDLQFKQPTTTLQATSMTTTPRPSLSGELHNSHNCYNVLDEKSGWIQHRVLAGRNGFEICHWLIQPSAYASSITLIFKEMTFYGLDNSLLAYVAVYEGSEPLDSKSLGLFTKTSQRFSVTSHSSSMLVSFQLEVEYMDRDVVFRAEYFSKIVETPSTPSPTDQPQPCFYRLSHSQGNFTMPPPPFHRRDIRDCKWHIYKPYLSTSDPTIHLIFLSLYLQHGASIVVYDGEDVYSPVLGRFNSSNPTTRSISLWSTGRDLFVQFTAPELDLDAHPLWIQFTANYHFEEDCQMYDETRCSAKERRCYTQEQRCDGVWDCPISGYDERNCGECGELSFSCGGYMTGICYGLHQRCDGKSTCPNHADENNCDERCSEDQNLFWCANKRCIRFERVCNGVDDCDDGSDEEFCKYELGSRYIIVWAVGGSLMGGLLLVLSVGIACKVYAQRHSQPPPQLHHHHRSRSSRYDTPLSRLQAEMFRRRAPPPPYHEAMLTSRPYDQAVREFFSQQSAAAEQERRNNCPREGTEGSHTENPTPDTNNAENQQGCHYNTSFQLEEGDQPLQGATPSRLEIRVTEHTSSDSNTDEEEYEGEEEEEEGEVGGLGQGEVTLSLHEERRRASNGQRGEQEERESIQLENISQDSASASLSADSSDSISLASDAHLPSNTDGLPEGDGGSGRRRERKESIGSENSVCILCLDGPSDPFPDDDDTDTDTRCLV